MLLTEFDEKLYKKSVYKEGYEDGVSEGYERGVDEGHKQGFDEARKQDLINGISMLKSIGMPDDKAVALIAENYSVYKEEILNLLKEDK